MELTGCSRGVLASAVCRIHAVPNNLLAGSPKMAYWPVTGNLEGAKGCKLQFETSDVCALHVAYPCVICCFATGALQSRG